MEWLHSVLQSERKQVLFDQIAFCPMAAPAQWQPYGLWTVIPPEYVDGLSIDKFAIHQGDSLNIPNTLGLPNHQLLVRPA